ncbi:MAG: DUF1156 domain-containing protein, partial [Kiloniellales bacterium]
MPLWRSRRPLAACRAILFGPLVHDRSSVPDEKERRRLFRLLENLGGRQDCVGKAMADLLLKNHAPDERGLVHR